MKKKKLKKYARSLEGASASMIGHCISALEARDELARGIFDVVGREVFGSLITDELTPKYVINCLKAHVNAKDMELRDLRQVVADSKLINPHGGYGFDGGIRVGDVDDDHESVGGGGAWTGAVKDKDQEIASLKKALDSRHRDHIDLG